MVQVPLCDRVGGEVNLEAPVQQETVPLVRPYPATDYLRSLEDGHLVAPFRKYLCAR